MKVFLSFIIKEFRHVLRDKRSLFILLGMPIAMILIFGFALSNEIRNAQVGVLAPKWDQHVKALVDRVDQSEYFSVNEIFHSQDEITAAFKAGRIKLAILFSPQFERSLQQSHQAQIQLIGDASDPTTGQWHSDKKGPAFRA